MINQKFVKILVIGFFFSAFLSLGSFFKVSANFPAGCAQPFGIPTACPTECKSQNDTGCYVPDFQCSNAKFLDPSVSCCNNKCANSGTVGSSGDQAEIRKFNIFGTQFAFSSARIPSLINIAISTFLGFVSAYALFRGMYIGAVVRSRATTSEDIAKANKEIVNLIIGFILAWSFIFIIQFVASVLGIGNLNDLNVTNTGSEITIT